MWLCCHLQRNSDDDDYSSGWTSSEDESDSDDNIEDYTNMAAYFLKDKT